MTTKAPGYLDVGSWLAELHMECYKKHLEDHSTIKSLLELRESDIKKLGVTNSKDRSRMMNSLAAYRGLKKKQEHFTPLVGQVAQVQEAHKSLLRKGSLKKLNIKSFLTSGGSKKNKNSKKGADPVQHISDLSLSVTVESRDDVIPTSTAIPIPLTTTTTTTGQPSLPPPPLGVPATQKPASSSLADYEELLEVASPLARSMTVTMETKTFQVPRHGQSVVENEYVPSPENSPNSSHQRHRANTFATAFSPEHQHFANRVGVAGYMASHLYPSQHSTPELLMHHHHQHHDTVQRAPSEEDSPGPFTHKHLSIVSMESGLSFGYDVEKDFNPSQPLEAQPWYHGKVARADAEALLHDDGDFLVRENTTMSNTFTLTLRWRGVADHTLIGTTEVISTTSMARGCTVKYQFDSGAFDSVPELIYNHLKYQIPVDTVQHTLITNPVCRPGNPGKGGMYTNLGVYAPVISHRSNLSPESSPSYSGSNNSRRSGSPSELTRLYPLRLGKPINASSNGERLSKHLSISSGDLLEASRKEDITTPRNVISPPPDTRGRAMTMSHYRAPGSSFGATPSFNVAPPHHGKGNDNHQRVDSFGDYEMMESVSILSESPSLDTRKPHPPQQQLLQPEGGDYHRAQSVSAGNSLNRSLGSRQRESYREKVKYAEIHYPRDGGPGVIVNSGSNSVNYAEVRFSRSNTISTPSSQQSHPFALYDVVPAGKREATPPRTGAYQSRADVLAQRVQAEPTYSIPNPSTKRRPASAHPVSNYATIQFPLRNPTPSAHDHTSSPSAHDHASSTLGRTTLTTPQTSNGSPQRNVSQVSIVETDASLYALPDKSRLSPATHELSSSNDSLLSIASSSHHSTSSAPKQHVIGSSLLHSHTPSAKVHRSLPGYEALVKAHTILQNHSNDELAYHMTRSDAVCFMLAPRPAEDKDIWRERVRQVTSSSGMFCGLQTLADPDGEKLWKKLYFRHLNLSQTVTLTVITAGDALERAKLVHRYVAVAQLLQGSKYGNLFSFVAVMQGLAAPQLKEMSEVWSLLDSHFPEEAATYKTLQATIAAVDQGETVLTREHLTIPPIQQLKAVFHFTEQSMGGFAPPAHQDRSIVGEYMSLAAGLEALRVLVASTTQFTLNAWRTLQGLQYNANLMEFLMQDFTRVYLQAISVHSDSPLERRRRLGLLMDALIDRVESSESV